MNSHKEVRRKIIHIDMDCFFAAVEIRDNPKLKGQPVAVGGSPDRRGVLSTANYEAREYGLRSAMSASLALRLCPHVQLVRGNFAKYTKVSQTIKSIFKKYTNQIQPLSLDEAYLDVTHSKLFDGSATLLAEQIRKDIFTETQLTASAGIAPNKFLAKVASDWKKPNGQFTVYPSIIDQFMLQLPVKNIPGVGKVTQKKMQSLNIKTCGDLQQYTINELSHYFGSWGVSLYDLSRGIDQRPVKTSSERKSLSVEHTYSEDLQSLEACIDKLPNLFDEFYERIDRKNLQTKIKSLFVKVKFHDFTQTTYESKQQTEPNLQSFESMVGHAFSRGNKPVRLIGLGVRLQSTKTKPKTPQLSLLD